MITIGHHTAAFSELVETLRGKN